MNHIERNSLITAVEILQKTLERIGQMIQNGPDLITEELNVIKYQLPAVEQLVKKSDDSQILLRFQQVTQVYEALGVKNLES